MHSIDPDENKSDRKCKYTVMQATGLKMLLQYTEHDLATSGACACVLGLKAVTHSVRSGEHIQC